MEIVKENADAFSLPCIPLNDVINLKQEIENLFEICHGVAIKGSQSYHLEWIQFQ